MVNREAVRTVVGIIGNVISCFLFLSPAPTFVKICKSKSTQAFKFHPYVATFLNCALWVFYGMPFVHPDSLLVVTINAAGLVFELVYIVIFLLYSKPKQRKTIVMFLIGELIFFVVVVTITLAAIHGTKKRSAVIGILCIILNVIMYTSPLTVMTRVIKTKSVKYMPFYLSLANFANGCVWFSYAFIKLDPYVLIPNGLGALSGLVQLTLYAIYYRTTNWDENESNEVEISGNSTGNNV